MSFILGSKAQDLSNTYCVVERKALDAEEASGNSPSFSVVPEKLQQLRTHQLTCQWRGRIVRCPLKFVEGVQESASTNETDHIRRHFALRLDCNNLAECRVAYIGRADSRKLKSALATAF